MARTLTCVALALFFATAGVLHFTQTDAFVAIVPPAVPFKRLIVQITGAMELALALGLLIPGARSATGWALSIYLLAVLPANIYMALAGIPLGSLESAGALWGRVALQFPLIMIVLWACRSMKKTGPQ